MRVKSFAPICAPKARALVLGTSPSVESLRVRQSYAHPRNAFWPIMFKIFGAEFSTDWDTRKNLLMSNGICLWDIACSCIRPGSLDSDMRGVVPNDINSFLSGLPEIKTVFFNGKTAEKFYDVFFERLETVNYMPMPSTSPAYASKNFEEKFLLWSKAFKEIL
ncbi:MAG: DNA-deoxyinosine glycosylase [Elusimicrobia bacterium]|nr:DNA-deoxyinosine glycosylase [Elusimicrobiota bacterium]